MRSPRCYPFLLVLVAVIVPLVGCHGLATRGGLRDVAASRKARQAEVAGQFNQSRTMAELQAARECFQRQDFPGCLAALEPLLKRNPDHVEGHLLLTETLLAQNRSQEAIARLQSLAERYPDDPKLQHMMGLLWDNAGDIRRACDYYQRASLQEPHNEVYRLSYQAAQRAAKEASPPVPSTVRGTTGNREPFSSGVRLTCHDELAEGKISAAMSQSSDPADVAASDPSEPCLDKDLQALRQGRVDAALDALQQRIAANPHDPHIVISAAVVALQSNQPEVAIALVKPALDRFPKSAALYRILATAHYRRGDYAASQTALQQALSLDKSCPLSYFLMGCTLSKLGQSEAAAEHFRRAQQLDPSLTVPQQSRDQDRSPRS